MLPVKTGIDFNLWTFLIGGKEKVSHEDIILCFTIFEPSKLVLFPLKIIYFNGLSKYHQTLPKFSEKIFIGTG